MVRQQRFTEDEKAEIRKAHDAGVPYAALAAQHGVSSATIMRVCRPDIYEKQKAANRKYQADNVKKIIDARKGVYKSYRLALHTENDAKIIKQLDKQDNVTDYVRQLVTSDIKTDDVKEYNSRSEN